MRLDGAAAVVTGAGSGIGRAAAMSFAARGASIVVSDVLEDRASETAELIGAAGGQAVSMAADVTDSAQLEALRDVCLGMYGRIDLVMNNVGVLAMGPPESMGLDHWQRVLDINVLGIVRSNLVFLPLLIKQGAGHLVNTASASGLLPHGFDRLPYVTSKHAVVGMSESLALYLRPRGVGVTCVCPSGVRTNIMEQVTFVGEAGTPRSPDYPMVEAAEVGELTAEAVEHGRFLVVTAQGVLDELVERAADVDAYLAKYS
jgi:NAD(P)-dependent dehydrogenase (short-subunit alcohol dehydrogenase family)